jgi:unsaturated chondroitin disaccharide hydrolase
MKLHLLLFLLVLDFSISSIAQNVNLDQVFSDTEKQTDLMLNEVNKIKNSSTDTSAKSRALLSPRTLTATGDLVLVSAKDWTSGFFPGILWFLFEYTGEPHWKARAVEFTGYMEEEKWNAGTHDMGFKMYCSYGTGYRLTKNEAYKDILIQSAKTLSKRFSPRTGCIRSWDHHADQWKFPVIIDNMMNLELLFAATRFTGDSSFYRIAVSHANTTKKNHFRKDYSSYHVVDYDPETGAVKQKVTHQGYSDASAWSRGQAWALYGFTMCYRETRNKAYLRQAENIAKFILNHPNLPKDLVPYWDFNAPSIPDEPRDASAAAVMASALYELSTYSGNAKQYKSAADKILVNLTEYYRSPLGENKGFILMHSTGSKPSKSELDVPLIYADYYYLEALLRSKKLKEKKKLY